MQLQFKKTELTKQGVLTYFEGFEKPERIFLQHNYTAYIEAVKRGLVVGIRLIKRFPFLLLFYPFLGSLFLDFARNVLKNIELEFSRFFERPVEELYCTSGREILKAGLFLKKELIYTIVDIWEFENAYRYMFQDLICSVPKQYFIDFPRQAVNALFNTWLLREQREPLKKKIKLFKSVCSLLLLSSRNKNLVSRFFKNLDYNKIRLDEYDCYWAGLNPDYNFDGLSFKQRWENDVKLNP